MESRARALTSSCLAVSAHSHSQSGPDQNGGRATPCLVSLGDTAITESTRHIRDAQQHPERSFPSRVGKTVPGATEPLHRLIDEDKQAANRRAAIGTCEDVWGDYAGTRLQCDEYPFASTKEGANAGDDRYSARLIDGKDNENGGRRLNSMYTANRILDGDPFYVKVTQ